jgi:sugar phosphate isomerase/epimerase
MLTRRTFFLTAGAVVPALAAGKLNLGIGAYTYHNLSIDGMVAQLLRLGIREIEMSRGEFMLFSKPKPERFASAREKFDAAGIRCVSYYTATIQTDAELDTAIQGAKALGARNITGDATGPILRQIDERCAREGLTFAIHNHFFKGRKFPYESPEDVLGALEKLSRTVGAALDTGQFAACGHDPVDAVRKLGSRLKMVHLKDIEGSGAEINVPLGKGIVRIPAVMAELRKVGYKGLVALEYEHEGPVEEDVRIQIEYARTLL